MRLGSAFPEPMRRGLAPAGRGYVNLIEVFNRDTRPMRELLIRTMHEATGNVLAEEQYGDPAASAIPYVHIPIAHGAWP